MHRTRIFKAFLLLTIISMFAGQALAKGKKKTLDGYLVDIACANERSNELSTLGIVHTKQCLQMGPCSRSGYALLTHDRKVIRFDAAGNQKASGVIASADQKNDFWIEVSGRINGDEIVVSQLRLLPPE